MGAARRARPRCLRVHAAACRGGGGVLTRHRHRADFDVDAFNAFVCIYTDVQVARVISVCVRARTVTDVGVQAQCDAEAAAAAAGAGVAVAGGGAPRDAAAVAAVQAGGGPLGAEPAAATAKRSGASLREGPAPARGGEAAGVPAGAAVALRALAGTSAPRARAPGRREDSRGVHVVALRASTAAPFRVPATPLAVSWYARCCCCAGVECILVFGGRWGGGGGGGGGALPSCRRVTVYVPAGSAVLWRACMPYETMGCKLMGCVGECGRLCRANRGRAVRCAGGGVESPPAPLARLPSCPLRCAVCRGSAAGGERQER